MPGLVWDINLFKRGSPMSIVSTGIDLAKNVFSIHGVDADGVVLIRRSVSLAKLSQLNVQLPPCLIGMEACSGVHEWARRFSTLGHSVKLMAPKFVAPYRKARATRSRSVDAPQLGYGGPYHLSVRIRPPVQRCSLCTPSDHIALLRASSPTPSQW